MRKQGVTAFSKSGEAEGAPVLQAEHLSVRHKIEDISLQVRAGEVVGLGGLLGSGRSETAKAIVGALPTDSGEVQIDGKHVRRGSTAG